MTKVNEQTQAPRTQSIWRAGLALLGAVLLTAVLIALAYQVPYTLRIDVGGDDGMYVRGFFPAENSGGRTYRWTTERAEIILHNAGLLAPNGALEIELTGFRPEDEDAAHVEMLLDDQPFANFDAPRDFFVKRFPVNAAQTNNDTWTFTLTSNLWRNEREGRAVGVAMDWVELTNQTPALPSGPIVLWTCIGAASIFLLAARWTSLRVAFVCALGFAVLIALGIPFAREGTVYLLPLVAGVTAALAAYFLAPLWWGRATVWVRPRVVWLAVGALLGLFVAETLLWRAQLQFVAFTLLAVSLFVIALLQLPLALPGASTSKGEWFGLALVTALAFFMRLYQLDAIPFAIFRDEARHGLVALRLLNDPTFRPIFLGPPISHPIPYFYALAGTFQALGANVFSLRLVSAVAGALAAPCLWVLARALFGARVAFVAAFGLAISSWHVTISRTGMPYVEPTIFALPGYFFLWRALQKNRLRDFALAGLFLALAQYAAQTSKAALLVAAAMVADELFARLRQRERASLLQIARGLIVMALVAIVVGLPLLIFITQDANAFFARPDQVAIWNERFTQGEIFPSLLASNVLEYLGAFHVAGDESGRHHLPGIPFVDPIFGVFLLLGAVIALQHLRQARARFLVYWLLLSLAPGILTIEAPSVLRVVEAAPAAYAVAGVGLVGLWTRLAGVSSKQTRRALRGAIALLLLVALVFNSYVYFVRMYESPGVWRKYAPIATRLAEQLNDLAARGEIPEGSRVFVPQQMLEGDDDKYTLQFLTQDRFKLRPLEDARKPGQGVSVVVIPNELGYWQLVAAVEPRYASKVERAMQAQQDWRAQIAGLVEGEKANTGAPFPATQAPTFEFYFLRP